jgi:hypothetical protein
MDRLQEGWRKEERLLSSALFEVGVKIMDRSIRQSLSLSASAEGQTTALDAQRLALAKASLASSLSSPLPTAGAGSMAGSESAVKRLGGAVGTPVLPK